MKRGFTLVELSIVLVIIGLLIGGILVAQSMIETAKISAQIRQLQQFDAAVTNFQTKYKSLPGDSSVMGCTGGYCNDALITDSGGDGANVYENGGEVSNFWPQLAQSGFTQDGASFTNVLTGSGYATTSLTRNGPRAAINIKAGVIAGTRQNGWGASPNIYEHVNVYQIADYSSVTNTNNNINQFANYAMTGPQVLAIDTKIDDGIMYTGSVVSAGVNYYPFFGYTLYMFAWPSGCGWDTLGKYATDNSVSCAITVKMMSQVGTPNK